MKKIIIVCVSLATLVACDSDTSKPDSSKSIQKESQLKKESLPSAANDIKERSLPTSAASEEMVTVILSKNHGETIISQQDIAFNPVDDLTVMDLMRKHFEITMHYDDKIIEGISNNYSSGVDQTAWVLSINDQPVTEDFTQIKIQKGDRIQFDLQSMK